MERQRGAAILPHINPHISAQLTAALTQDEVWWEYVPWFDQLVDEPFDIRDGAVHPSRAPGSGLEPSLDSIERLAQSPWQPLGS